MKAMECYMDTDIGPPENLKPTEPPRGGSRRKKSRPPRPRYTPEFRLKAVELYLKGGYTYNLLCQEMGVNKNSLILWLQKYRQGGPEALVDQPRRRRGRHLLPAAITTRILELKRQHPTFGIHRISQLLRRWFLLAASPTTVRQRLQEAQLMPPAPRVKQRNLTRPRFFERATPNQLWQTDIFTFRLGGRYAYLIAYLDDYSRYVVGADLFRSPTAEAVIEVYRVAIGEFKPPQEMLTDNGRQYTSWRGTSRFEAELRKDRVSHIKSRPHHPMTLGKIERFWSSLWQEFLVRTQFESFEAARERIKLWIKYYNHKRPHQGLDGLCPADRFFEIQTELRQTLEAGIQANLLELALRGQPQAPFYMVGRMDGQSVVLRAEKGKLKLSVTDDHNQPTQELTYDLHQKPAQPRPGPAVPPPPQTPPQPGLQRPGEGPGDPGPLDRPLQTGGHLPPDAHQLDHAAAVAGPGDGGHAASFGEPGESLPGRGLEPAAAAVVAEAEPGRLDRTAGPAPDPAPAIQACQSAGAGAIIAGHEPILSRSSPTGAADPPGPGGADHGHGGRAATGSLPQDLLSVGAPGAGGHPGIPSPASSGTAAEDHRPGEGRAAPPSGGTGAENQPDDPSDGTASGGAGTARGSTGR